MRALFFPVWTSTAILWYLALMTLHADRLQFDDPRLPPPRPHPGTGGMIYTIVLGVPGVLDYPEHGYSKYTPVEVLRDQAWLDSMVGVPVVDSDEEAHSEGQDPTTIAEDSVGRSLKTWFDDKIGLPLAEVVVDVDRGLRAIANGKRWVSSAYDPVMIEEVGEFEGRRYTRREVRRERGNNIALTFRPRAGPKSILQADAQGGTMTREELVKRLTADARAADAEGAAKDPIAWAFDQLMRTSMDACMRADTAEKAMADMKAKADAAPPSGEEDEPTEEMDMEEAADAVRTADSLSVPVKGKLSELRRAIAEKMGVPNAGKIAADALPGVITAFLAGQASRRSAAERALDGYEAPPKPGAADARTLADHLNDLEHGVLA